MKIDQTLAGVNVVDSGVAGADASGTHRFTVDFVAEILALEEEGDVDQADQHRHFHERADHGGERSAAVGHRFRFAAYLAGASATLAAVWPPVASS